MSVRSHPRCHTAARALSRTWTGREPSLTQTPSHDLLPSLEARAEPSKKEHDSVNCHRIFLLCLDPAPIAFCLGPATELRSQPGFCLVCPFFFLSPLSLSPLKYRTLITPSCLSSEAIFLRLFSVTSLHCIYLFTPPFTLHPSPSTRRGF